MSNPSDSPKKPPTHRGFKIKCPKEGERRGRRQALVDFAKFCKAGCPFYNGKDVTGVFCTYRPQSDSSEPKQSSSISRPL